MPQKFATSTEERRDESIPSISQICLGIARIESHNVSRGAIGAALTPSCQRSSIRRVSFDSLVEQNNECLPFLAYIRSLLSLTLFPRQLALSVTVKYTTECTLAPCTPMQASERSQVGTIPGLTLSTPRYLVIGTKGELRSLIRSGMRNLDLSVMKRATSEHHVRRRALLRDWHSQGERTSVVSFVN